MKTDWRTYANNIGHKDWNGCFRCHDGNHKTADGNKTIAASDCRSCHLILAQGSGEQLKKLNADGYEFFHIDSEVSEFSCAMCHTGSAKNSFFPARGVQRSSQMPTVRFRTNPFFHNANRVSLPLSLGKN